VSTPTPPEGLYGKYYVEKNGEPIESCFVLNPESDPAARDALLAYADATNDSALAADIRAWVDQIEGPDADWYVLTDGDGEPIPGESYSDCEQAIDARARLMADHEDGDKVTVEPRENDETTDDERDGEAA